MDLQKTEAACACAKREREQRAKDLSMKATISVDEITNAKPELDMIHKEKQSQLASGY